MRIGLMGFEFQSPNKGCEALVYSFLSVLNEALDKNIIIINFSGTELGMIPSYFNHLKFENVNPTLKDIKFKYINALRKCDIIFDVTMGDSFSDIYSEEYYNGLIRHKLIAETVGKKYVLLPQTYGPFKTKKSEKKAKKVFDKAYKIYCRDELSQQLLSNNFGITDSILSSDMAFILPFEKEQYNFSNKPKMGINVSGLLYKGGFYDDNQFGLSINYPELIERMITNFMNIYTIHLIPHVIDLSADSYDDDYKICEILHKKYPETILSPVFNTPIEAKNYISMMDVFIGSRMHSTIASFSSNVTTIPISYSRKFEGLFGSLNYPYVVNARKESTDSAFELISKLLTNANLLNDSQQKSNKMILKKNEYFKTSIKKLLEEI